MLSRLNLRWGVAGRWQAWRAASKSPAKKKRPPAGAARAAERLATQAYAVAPNHDLSRLTRPLVAAAYRLLPLPPDSSNAICVQSNIRTADDSVIFLFEDGSAVFWNCSESERTTMLELLRHQTTRSYEPIVAEDEMEEIDYLVYGANDASPRAYMKSGTIYFDCPPINGTTSVSDAAVAQPTPDEPQFLLEKFAYSNALALSVQLSVVERQVSELLDSVEWLSDSLQRDGRVSVSHRKLLQLLGRLYCLRNQVNLKLDLGGLPDFYWDRASLEALFMSMRTYLSLPARTRLVNDKIRHGCDLAELLSDHLSDRHHTRVEWLIVLLIAVEVLLELRHLLPSHS